MTTAPTQPAPSSPLPDTPLPDAPPPPAPIRRLRRRILGAVAGVVVLTLGASTAWVLTRPAEATATTREVQASLSTITQSTGTTGTIEPARRVDLSFTSAGEVSSVLVQVGDTVSAGSSLAAIDTTELTADVEAAVADAEAARADYTDALGHGTTAQATAARSAWRARQRALADARDALAAGTLTSPIDGTVALVNVAVGDIVGAGAAGATASGTGAAASSAAIVVISTDAWIVETSVGSADLAHVRQNMQAEITPDSGDTLYGTVSSVGVIADSSSTGGTASFPVTIRVTGTPEGLHAGASASVQIIHTKRADVLTVPTAAITTNASGQTVVTRRSTAGDAEAVVVTGAASGNLTEITSGLAEGDTVLVTSRAVAASASAGTSGQQAGGFPDGGPGGFEGAPPAGAPPGQSQTGTGTTR